jgi:hypothetical protein
MLRLGLQDGTVKALGVLELAFPMGRYALLQSLIYPQFHLGSVNGSLPKKKVISLRPAA